MERDACAVTPGFHELDVGVAYRELGPGLLGFVINEIGDRGLAEELVQEVFVRAWQSGERFDPRRGSLRTWLFAIARNLVIDARRARSARPPLALVAGTERALPDDFTAGVEARMQVYAAMQEISEAHREVIVQVHLHGRSYDELSARTGVPVATLRTRAYHGLRALRQAMESTGWTGRTS
ncbi:MAG: sigma-70 family RNA polymerase sigma factor [Actinomycetota bacterium]|nr:sigma-70 family RNA polymerase sigma factor [Actinomycetota bacterium]